MPSIRLVTTIVLAAGAVLAASGIVPDSTFWNQYRGPHRDGHYTEGPIVTTWPGGSLVERWRVNVGLGYAGISVAAGKVFTIDQRGKNEAVAAYDFQTGEELWYDQWPGRFSSFMGGKGPRSTPTWHEGRLFVLGALGEFRCLNADTGEVIWRKNILEENTAEKVRWGLASSPLVVDGRVIVQPGGRNGRSVVAYHVETGETLWTSLDDRTAYASPMSVTLAGKRQILVMTAEGAAGLDPEDGKPLWRHPWKTGYDVNAAQPVIAGENRFLISSGYGHGAALVEVDGGPGDYGTHTVWENKYLKNKFSSSVIHGGHVYGLDEGILSCLDLETGHRIWKGGRYGHGQVLLADGHLIITAATGQVVLVQASPEGHRELASFQAVKGKTWNTPALAGGCLIVRSGKEMASFRIAPE